MIINKYFYRRIIMKGLEHILIIFLIGFLVGSLLALSMRYPLQLDSIDKYKHLCAGSTIETVKVGLSGDIYEIKCANGYTTKP